MDDSTRRAVHRAIVAMRENLSEPITIDDLASAALFSKFHFSRVFQRATGVSPGRFLSALRLQRAKDLLISTSLNVADISLRVGYSSVGTFSSRFSRSVGMSPTAYRRGHGFIGQVPTIAEPHCGTGRDARVFGKVTDTTAGERGLVFVGLFAERIPEGQPVGCAALELPAYFDFTEVPSGTWYLLAQSVSLETRPQLREAGSAEREVLVATHGPITVGPGDVLEVDLALEPAQALDPPVLLALLDARNAALQRVAEQGAVASAA